MRASGRKSLVCVMVILQSNTVLLEIVAALTSPRRFSRRLDGGQQQRDENANDRDYDEQFHKGKPDSSSATEPVRHSRHSLTPHNCVE